MACVIFTEVTVDLPIYNSDSQSFRNMLAHVGSAGRIRSATRKIVTVRALDRISLELGPGDRLGLLGGNGAGKTTLLRTIAGIFPPTSGQVRRIGGVSTLLGLGAGLMPDLTGYENAVRVGMLLGLSHGTIINCLPEIEDFTELGSFMAAPVRTYSAGMLTRLLFAVATSVQPEILLIDEVIGAGDLAFQTKASKRMLNLVQKSKIVVFASHSETLVKLFCNRTMTLDGGRVISEDTLN